MLPVVRGMEPSKLDLALNWIAQGMLRVHCDARSKGAILPVHLRSCPDLILEWGLDLARPIRDLKIDHEGISGTLSFDVCLPMFCFLPWSCVYGLSSPVLEQAKVWLNDAPAHVQRELLGRAGERANEKLRQAQERETKPRLRLVKGGK